MIFQGSRLRVVDNSGALTALCIKVFGKSPRCPAHHGDKIKIVIKSAIAGKKVKKSEIFNALVVWSPTNKRRIEGHYIKFAHPACVILKKDNQPIGNKIRGPVYKELRSKGHLKLISIATIAL